MPAALRSQLTDTRQRVTDLRDRIAAARAERDQARQRFVESGAPPDNESVHFRAAERGVAIVRELEDQLALVQDEERYLLDRMAGVDGQGLFGGRNFLREPETLSTLAQVANSTAPIGRLQLGAWADRQQIAGLTGRAVSLAAGEATPTDRARDAPHRGTVPLIDRPLTFLDLLVTEEMDGRSVPYLRETGSGVGAAATVPEGAVKPAATIDFMDAEAKASTIAHHTKIYRQSLGDVPALETILRNRLTYGVLRQLEQQVISGDGVGSNLRGILNTTGIGAPVVAAGSLPADRTLDAILAVMVEGAVPNVIALHPQNWGDMLRAKAAGSGEYLSAGPFVDTARRLWGTTVVPALGIPQGTALVGDTTIGATLLVREGVNVLVSDSDSDDFIRNRVTILGEGRWGLAVWLPSAWARVSLA